MQNGLLGLSLAGRFSRFIQLQIKFNSAVHHEHLLAGDIACARIHPANSERKVWVLESKQIMSCTQHLLESPVAGECPPKMVDICQAFFCTTYTSLISCIDTEQWIQLEDPARRQQSTLEPIQPKFSPILFGKDDAFSASQLETLAPPLPPSSLSLAFPLTCSILSSR